MIVLTVVDRFSKMAHFIVLPKLHLTSEMAEAVLLHVFRLHGLPQDQADGGVCQPLFWFPPQTNGQMERYNQEMQRVLRCITVQNLSSWSQHLLWVEYAHNSLPVTSTSLSPFQCVGLPASTVCRTGGVSVPWFKALVHQCNLTWKKAQSVPLCTNTGYQKAANCQPAPCHWVGQRVWLSTQDVDMTLWGVT